MSTDVAAFPTSFAQQMDLSQEPEALRRLRAQAWSQFCSMGLPGPKDEAFQYMHLKPLLVRHLAAAPVAEGTVGPATLLFTNGHLRLDCSNLQGLEQCTILPLPQAMRVFGTLLSERFAASDPFAALNAAAHQSGIFIYVPPRVVVEQPLQIVHLIDAADSFAMPRIHLVQGASSALTLITSTTVRRADGCFTNSAMDVVLEENASLQLIQMTLEGAGHVFDHLHVTQKRASNLNRVQITTAPAITRHATTVHLAGEAAETNLSGLWLLDAHEVHSNIRIEHQQPNTRSLQNFKGVLNGTARSSFQGKIYVHPIAQKTQAYQLNNNLILSDAAQANSKPNLEIFADDVKATHGATMGKLNEEELFYLRTRGLPLEVARSCLIHGFCNEILQCISVAHVREQCEQQIHALLSSESTPPLA